MSIPPAAARKVARHAPMLLAMACGAWCIRLRLLSESLPDAGDGLAHYMHAKYAWVHAAAGLSQWGKPVFSLLSAPFAWFGPTGVVLFCALCTVLACAVIIYSLPERAAMWRWSVPLLVFSQPVVPATIAGGLTEPLFGLWATLVVAALLKERTRSALILTSFTPFVRPEYVVLAPLVVLRVTCVGQWRQLPWGLLGIGLYTLASGMLLGKPFAFFMQHSYLGNTIYGTGALLHFVERFAIIWGPWFAMLFLLCLVGLPLIWHVRPREARALAWPMALTVIPSVGILALHSYAWWRGDLASLGLVRVLATAAPLAAWSVVLVLAEWTTFFTRSNRAAWGIGLLFTVGYGLVVCPRVATAAGLPATKDAKQMLLHTVANQVQSFQAETNGRIWTNEPLLIVLLDLDPWDSTRTKPFLPFIPHASEPPLLPNDLLIWDSHFAGYEARIPADSLFADGRLRYLARIYPDPPFTVIGEQWFHVDVLRAMPTVRWVATDTLVACGYSAAGIQSSLPACDTAQVVTLPDQEFPWTVARLRPLADGTLDETLTVVGEMLSTDTADRYITLAIPGPAGDITRNLPLPYGAFHVTFRIPPTADRAGIKCYIWDVNARGDIRLRNLRLLRTAIHQTAAQ